MINGNDMRPIFCILILFSLLFILSGCMEKLQIAPDMSSMCNNLQAQEKQDCLARVNINTAIKLQNQSMCENMNATERRECEITVIISRAITNANPAICDELSPSNLHKLQICQDNALLSKAKMRKDPSICKEITIPSIKNSCEAYHY